MLVIISPAKSLDFETKPAITDYSIPDFIEESEVIITKLRKMNPAKIQNLMGISPKLAQLNFDRFQNWQLPFSPDNAKQAVLAFTGDVYQGLDAKTLSDGQLKYAQNHLRILSGLYGVLRPLDLMQAYRLEMGTKLPIARKKDLYAFWKLKIVPKLNEAVKESGTNVLINLASNEYFKSIDKKKLDAEIITPEFKEGKNGTYKMVSLFAKKARGLMTRFIIENRISDPEELKAFSSDGYMFNAYLSQKNKLVFTRDRE